jgi:hypothetical protein
MKIEELRLVAVGPFTDVTLDLSGGNRGFHVIYGPNEAGKSSALGAIRYLLYGFPTRLGDDFVHSYAKRMPVNGSARINFGPPSGRGTTRHFKKLWSRNSASKPIAMKNAGNATGSFGLTRRWLQFQNTSNCRKQSDAWKMSRCFPLNSTRSEREFSAT